MVPTYDIRRYGRRQRSLRSPSWRLNAESDSFNIGVAVVVMARPISAELCVPARTPSPSVRLLCGVSTDAISGGRTSALRRRTSGNGRRHTLGGHSGVRVPAGQRSRAAAPKFLTDSRLPLPRTVLAADLRSAALSGEMIRPGRTAIDVCDISRGGPGSEVSEG